MKDVDSSGKRWQILSSVKQMWKWNNQHVTSVGQRRSLSQSDRIWTYDLPNIGRALYQRQMFGRSYTVGSKPVGDPDFFLSYARDMLIISFFTLIANERPREDARLRGGNLIEPCAIVPGAKKISNRCNIE